MCTVFVHVDSSNVFAVYIASQMRAFINHQAKLASLVGQVGKGGAEETGADYQEIVVHRIVFVRMRASRKG